MSKYKSFFVIIFIIFVSGCSHYKTIDNSENPALRPRILKGTTDNVQHIAYEAAKKAFPDETENIKIKENNKIIILREWFWRGDSKITVNIEKKNSNEHLITAESKSSWHRLNPTGFAVAKDEILEYLSALDQTYEAYLSEKQRDDSTESARLSEKLKELKQAFDKGLINKTEYNRKRQDIINEF